MIFGNRSILLLWLLCLLAPVPLLISHYREMLQHSQYSFLPILWILLAVMAFQRWDRVAQLPRGAASWTLLTLSFVILGLATFIWSPWLGCFANLITYGVFLFTHRDRLQPPSRMTYLWPPLLLGLRLPLGLDNSLTTKLQQLTSRLSSYFLDLLEIPHVLTGNVFQLMNGTLFVEEACSGVQSLFALSAATLLLLAYQRRPLASIPIYLAFAMIWAGVFNIVRVTTIAVAQEWYQADLAHGVPHEVLGYTCLGLAVLTVLSMDRLFQVLFFAVPYPSRDTFFNPLIRLWNTVFSFTNLPVAVSSKASEKTKDDTPTPAGNARGYVLAVMSIIGCALLGGELYVMASAEDRQSNVASDQILWTPPQELIAGNVDGFTLVNYSQERGTRDQPMGQFADIWSGDAAGLMTRVAVCQPYPEPHGLNACYQGIGWLEKQSEVVKHEADGAPWNYTRTVFTNPDGRFGYLVYSCLDDEGRPVSDAASGVSRLWDRLWELDPNRMKKLAQHKFMMIQLWAISDTELTDEQFSELESVHRQARELIRAKAAETLGRDAN